MLNFHEIVIFFFTRFIRLKNVNFVTMKRIVLFAIFFAVLTFNQPSASAQCSMCSANAEMSVKNGNTQGKGLNSGILYLLAIPYLLISGVGILWYVNYRKKNNVSSLHPGK